MQMLPRLTFQLIRNALLWLGLVILFIAIGEEWLRPLLPQTAIFQTRWSGNILMLLGLIFGIRSHFLILQLGQPTGLFRLHTRRLVRIGYYARNRHPQWWSLQLWIMGALLTAEMPWLVAVIIVSLNLTIGSIYLLLVEESLLANKFGERYKIYKREVPFWGFRINAPDAEEPGWVYLCAFILGQFLFRWRFKITAEGLENIPDAQNFIIVAPHACYFDPFLLGIFVPVPVHFVTTADAYTNPVKQWFMHRLYTFPIRRHVQDLPALRKVIKLTSAGKVVGIFPEGERSMDGRPGEIVPETIRLLQHCRVPILPVEIHGAFEIWPRWSNVLRKGRVHVRFNPVIPVGAQVDRARLTEKIRETIFPKKMAYQSVSSDRMTKGIEKLLWGCIACGAHDRIVETSAYTIQCQNCGRIWNLEPDYHLMSPEGDRIPLVKWIDRLKDQIQPMNWQTEHELMNGEVPYLSTELTAYFGPESEAPQYQNTELILTDKAFLIRNNGRELARWRHSQITVLTVDTKTDFSLGVSGKRHLFRLPPPEHPLKWHNFFKTVTSVTG